MQIKPINYVDIENLPFDYDPDKNPYNKAFGLKRTSKEITFEEFDRLCVENEKEGNAEKIVLPDEDINQVEHELDMVDSTEVTETA